MLFKGEHEHEKGALAQKGQAHMAMPTPSTLVAFGEPPEQGIHAATVDRSVGPEGIGLQTTAAIGRTFAQGQPITPPLLAAGRSTCGHIRYLFPYTVLV